MKFILCDDWKPENGDINVIPEPVLLLILRQLPPGTFFALRLATRKFKYLADNSSFVWEPREVHPRKARTFLFNLGKPQPQVGGNYYMGTQMGEYRWPAGELLLCREKDNIIEIKTLSLDCEFKGELVGHQSRITVLKPLSKGTLASGDESGRVFIWRKTQEGVAGTELASETHRHTAKISSIAHFNDDEIFTADKSGVLKCWFLSTHAFRWEKKFQFPVVSLKVLSKDELEIVSMDDEKGRFHISIHDLENGEKIRDESDLQFGVDADNRELQNFSSFFNGAKVDFRLEVLGGGEQNYSEDDEANGFGASRRILVYQGAISSEFHPAKNMEDFLNNNVSVFSNSGNILFWRNDGKAKLVFHKRLPFTYGKDLAKPQVNDETDNVAVACGEEVEGFKF